MKDVSEQYSLQRLIKDSKKKEDEEGRAKSEFFANMSHEMRTPLNVILGFYWLLARSPNLSGEQRYGLERIRHSGEQLLGMVNEILGVVKESLDVSRNNKGNAENYLEDPWKKRPVNVLAGERTKNHCDQEESPAAPDEECPSFLRRKEIASILEDLPEELLSRFDEAVRLCDVSRVELVLGEIGGINPVLERFLRSLADDFAYDEIERFLDED